MSDYFDRITTNCQPSSGNYLDWTAYSTPDFGAAFLPKITARRPPGMAFYDGAELLSGFTLKEDKTVNVTFITYPDVVLAADRVGRITAFNPQVVIMIQINDSNNIEIRFKFGKDFKNVLQNYIDDFHPSSSVVTIESSIYVTPLQGFNLMLTEMKEINKNTTLTGFAAKMLLLMKIMGFASQFFEASKDITKAVEEESKNVTGLDRFLLYNDFSGITHYSEEERINLDRDYENNLWTNYDNGKSNSDLYLLDSTFRRKVDEFRLALNNAGKSEANIRKQIRERAADLFKYGKARISEQKRAHSNKDGLLYLARMIMLVTLKNHQNVIGLSTNELALKKLLDDLADLFEKHSRGLEGSEKPKFSTSSVNILVSGFDPFTAAYYELFQFSAQELKNKYDIDKSDLYAKDKDGHQSNPSGNLALVLQTDKLTMDGKPIVSKSQKNVNVKSVIFPVRFKEFDDGWVENFFTSYVKDNNIHLIITFSHGIGGTGTYSFEMERFAAQYRGENSKDNNQDDIKNISEVPFLNDRNKPEFIETTLPVGVMFIDDEVGLDQAIKYRLLMGTTQIGDDLIEPNPVENDLPISPLIKEPTLTNYAPFGSTADYLRVFSGPGGNYLSNEIYYRVGYLRIQNKPQKQTGHIHLGFLQGDPSTDRVHMLNIIKKSIAKAVEAL